jgi:hypothetical protein
VKKLITSISLLFTTTLFANSPLHFDNKQITLNSSQPKYSAVLNYPQISNPTTPSEKKFNQLAKKWALINLDDFKKSVSENSQYSIPKDLQAAGSTLNVTYDLTSLEPAKLVSLRVSNDTSMAGAAHPSRKYSAYNYDLTKNKAIVLSSLFKNESAALGKISKLATQRVTAQLKENPNGGNNVEIFSDGLTPTAKNYQVWNIVTNGMQITFNEYQVAAYVYGPQVITLSFEEIKDLLKSDNPLAKCLANNSCDIKVLAPNKQADQ